MQGYSLPRERRAVLYGCRVYLVAMVTALAVTGSLRAESVSFRNDVMAVFSKAGCNMGTCHGNKNGKGGFKLSLRAADPQADFLTLTRDVYSRRVNPIDPDTSLLLHKPLMEVAHEGGRRFARGSQEHRILRTGSREASQRTRRTYRTSNS